MLTTKKGLKVIRFENTDAFRLERNQHLIKLQDWKAKQKIDQMRDKPTRKLVSANLRHFNYYFKNLPSNTPKLISKN